VPFSHTHSHIILIWNENNVEMLKILILVEITANVLKSAIL